MLEIPMSDPLVYSQTTVTSNVPHALLALNVKQVPMVSISRVPDTPLSKVPIKSRNKTVIPFKA
jgi:hypothetical protein